MVVGVLQLTIFISSSQSLKDKRAVLRKIKSRVRNEFNVSISECGDHDLWQRALLGICQIGVDQAYIDGALHAVVRFIDEMFVAEIGEEKVEFLHY